MDCKYSFREEQDSTNRRYIYCTVSKEICPIVRYCQTIGNIVNLDKFEEKCTIYKNETERLTMKKGEYKVLSSKRGVLFIELDGNTIIQLDNPFDYNPTSVELVKTYGKYYISGFEPKREQPKKD